MTQRRNYYDGLGADYSRPGLVPEAKRNLFIKEAEEWLEQKESALPEVDKEYTLQQIEKENRDWWPSHCEALRQSRGDLLTGEYHKDLVYFCQDGPFYGLDEQKEREKHWWALLAQPGVTMCWPIVMFWGEHVHFEWNCLDDTTGETLAKGSVCWVRRGHRGGCYFKSEQLTFYRDVFAPQRLLTTITELQEV